MKNKQMSKWEKENEEARKEQEMQEIKEGLGRMFGYIFFLIITTASIYTGYWLISKLLN